jgi:hypothetical protein
MSSTVIEYDLTSSGKSFLSQFTSADYSDLIQSGLIPLDLLFTYCFRYGRVVDNDIPDSHGEKPGDDQGPMINYTHDHPAVGVIITIIFALVASASAYAEYARQRNLKKNRNSHFIFEKLNKLVSNESDDRLRDINVFLQWELQKDKELQKRFEYFRLSADGSRLQVKIKTAPPVVLSRSAQAKNFLHTAILTVWESLNLTSFTYWILWIGAGIFTGHFAVGVDGIPAVVGFGLPILAGLTFPVVKIYNYFKNKKPGTHIGPDENGRSLEPAIAKEADKASEKALCVLMRRALLTRDYAMKTRELEEENKKLQAQLPSSARTSIVEEEPVVLADETALIEATAEMEEEKHYTLSLDEEIKSLSKNKKIKTAITLLATLGGTFVAIQYAAWIVLDLVKFVANVSIGTDVVSLIVGAGLGAITLVVGIHAAVKRYREVGSFADKSEIKALDKAQAEETSLEEKLNILKSSIAHLQEKSGLRAPVTKLINYNNDQFFTNVERTGPTKTTKWKKRFTRLYHLINGVCTGIFIGRLFLLKGSATAMFFVVPMLSTPATIGLIVAIGVIYGLFKTYQYHQARKEARAKMLLEQRAERITCLKHEIEFVALQEKNLFLQSTLNENAEMVEAKPEAENAKVEVVPALVERASVPPRNSLFNKRLPAVCMPPPVECARAIA